MNEPRGEPDFATATPASARRLAAPFLRRAVWMWALVLLVAFNLWLACFGNDFFSRLNPRARPMSRAFGVAEEEGWDAFREWRRLDRGRHIVWIGDSAGFGGRTAAHRTFAALLEKKLRERFPSDDISVDNFSVAGANAPEKLALLRQLAIPADALVVVQLRADEWGHGTPGFLAETAWLRERAGELMPLRMPCEDGTWVERRQAREEGLSRVARRWIPMLRFRERMSMYLFGGTDAAKTLISRDRFRQAGWLTEGWRERLTRKSRSKPWTTASWDRARFDRWRREHPFKMDPSSLEYHSLTQLLAEVEGAHPGRVLVCFSPHNTDLLKAAMPESGFRDLVGKEIAWLKSRAGDVENLFDAIPSECFYDNIHLTDEGHARMAEVLLPIMEKRMRGLGWGRGNPTPLPPAAPTRATPEASARREPLRRGEGPTGSTPPSTAAGKEDGR